MLSVDRSALQVLELQDGRLTDWMAVFVTDGARYDVFICVRELNNKPAGLQHTLAPFLLQKLQAHFTGQEPRTTAEKTGSLFISSLVYTTMILLI